MTKYFKNCILITWTLLFISCGNRNTEKVLNNKLEQNDSNNIVDQDQEWIKDSTYNYSVIQEFPTLRNLNGFSGSEFVTSLESDLSKDKNSIYSVTLLYAWNEIVKIIGKPTKIINPTKEFKFLYESKSFKEALDTDDYKVNLKFKGDTISAFANYNKSLPFLERLDNFEGENKLKFEDKYVSCFGVEGFDYMQSEELKILFYKDDNNFVIKLRTENKKHEIFLFKSSKSFASLKDYQTELEKYIKIGELDLKKNKKNWRYKLFDEDHVFIPKIKFNIESNFGDFEGQKLLTKNNEYKILKASQRNAFLIYEAGVGIESEARMDAQAAAAGPLEELPKPKKMQFDKPFFIMLKKTDSKFPYFAMRVVNNELMTIEK